MSSSPPGYSASHNGAYDAYPQPQPQSKPARPGSVRHRKSSTIIPICTDESPSPPSPSLSPSISTALLPEFATYDNSSRSSFSSNQQQALVERTDSVTSSARSLKIGQRTGLSSVPLERRGSNSSSAAEEGEATPLLGDDVAARKWYEGPMFVAGVKLSLLFFVFTAVVAGTFYFGMPKLDP